MGLCFESAPEFRDCHCWQEPHGDPVEGKEMILKAASSAEPVLKCRQVSLTSGELRDGVIDSAVYCLVPWVVFQRGGFDRQGGVAKSPDRRSTSRLVHHPFLVSDRFIGVLNALLTW